MFVDPVGLKEYNLTYEFIDAKEFNIIQKVVYEPWNKNYVNSPQDIIADLKSIKANDPDAVFKTFSISNHGLRHGCLDFGTIVYNYKDAVLDIKGNEDELRPEYVESKEFLMQLSELLSENGSIYFIICYAGAGEAGKQLQLLLQGIFKDGQSVKLYDTPCGFLFGKPKATKDKE